MNDFVIIDGKKTVISPEQAKIFAAILSVDAEAAAPKAGESLDPREVSEIVKSGKAPRHFEIHQVLRFGNIEVEVIDFNRDKSIDSPSRPTMTVFGKKIIKRRPMHTGECPRGWVDTDLREWLDTEAFDALPEELRAVIVPVRRCSRNYEGAVFVAEDRLFVPSESEVFGSAIWSNHESGRRYRGFNTSEHRIRYDDDGEPCPFWCLSSAAGSATAFTFVNGDGSPRSFSAAASWVGVPLCFCL